MSTMMEPTALRELAREIIDRALAAGASEAGVYVATGEGLEIQRRDRRIERLVESRSSSLNLRLLVQDRFSTHGTSDLRPAALSEFVEKAVALTRLLEADPDRALPLASECGLADSPDLDLSDPTFDTQSVADWKLRVQEMEDQVLERASEGPFRSCTAFIGKGRASSITVLSNGFEGWSSGTSFARGAELTLEDRDGRLPESSSSYSTCHLQDLPAADKIATELWDRAKSRLGSSPLPSGSYPVLIENRAVGKVIGALLNPLSGATIHHGRSCLADRIGTVVAPETLTITDDPLIPRSPSSGLFDSDCFPSRQRAIIERGVIQTFYLNLYYARKLKLPPTTGGASNIVLLPGARSPKTIAAELGRVILVESFLGGNANPSTGDFSLGIRGSLLVNGHTEQPVSEMNLSGNLFDLWQAYLEAANDPWLHGSIRAPSLMFGPQQFSGQ